MAGNNIPADLQTTIQKHCTRIRKSKSTVLFRRGEKSTGMFIVISGKVTLDFGVDGSLAINRAFGPGALVGLPAALTKRNYSMTATVTADAELGFLPSRELDSLLREHSDLCQELLRILGERISENQELTKAILNKEQPPSPHANIA
jgi:CRP-like cAMP-binding protein